MYQTSTETTSVICLEFPSIQQKEDLKMVGVLKEGDANKNMVNNFFLIAEPFETLKKW